MKTFYGKYNYKGLEYEFVVVAKHNYEAHYKCLQQLAKQLQEPVMELKSYFADCTKQKQHQLMEAK